MVKVILDKGANVSATGNILQFSWMGYMNQKIATHVGCSQDGFGSLDDIFPLISPCTFTGVPPIIKEKIMRTLLSAGADANQRTALGQTALHALSTLHCGLYSPYRQFSLDDDDYDDDDSNEKLLMKALIDYGADINIRDDFGRPPLHYAAQIGNGHCAKFLLKNGADVYLKDNRGLTVLEQASNRDYQLTLALIEKYNFPMKKVIQAYECAAILALSYAAETLRKATLLRQEHGIPKTVLPPVECYFYEKEWETSEELDRYGDDEFQLSLSCLLARERISIEKKTDVLLDHCAECK